jgi:RNA polymerase sigma factor (sigma-70 family)
MDRVIREISRTLLKSGPELADGQLLEMFRVQRNEAAFEAIVQRHGPMVLAVCRRILRNHHDAEDAFQATFIVLARKSASIAPRDMAASWLHGVAVRTAQKARTQAARVRTRELQAASSIDPRTATHESDFDLQDSLDRELARLPAKYRTPIVLCELEGKSHKEAARELHWPEGTLSVRLMRAKKLLAQRLVRQGLGTTAGAIAILSAASVSSTLASSSVTFASQFATGGTAAAAIPDRIAGLAEKVLRSLFMSKMKTLVGTIVLLGVLFGGVAFSVRAMSAGFQAAKPVETLVGQVPEKPKNAKTDVPDEKSVVAVDGPKKVRLDSFGDPLPEGAAARLGARRFRYYWNCSNLGFAPDGKTLMGNTTSGLMFWDAATGIERKRLLMGAGLPISPDGTTLASLDADGVGLWDLRSDKKLRTVSTPEWKRGKTKTGYPVFPESNVFPADGKSLVVGTRHGSVMVFDLPAGEFRASLGDPDSFYFDVFAVSPDSNTLIAVTSPASDIEVPESEKKPQSMRWWDLATGKPIRGVDELPHRVKSMAFSPDNKTLALGIEANYEIVLLDVATGKTTGRMKAEKSDRKSTSVPRIAEMAFTPDSKKLIAASLPDCVLRVWDLAAGKPIHVFQGRDAKDGFLSMSLSPDGKTVALGQLGSVVRLWDVATGNEKFAEQRGHESLIRALAFSPDGKTLASGGWFGQTFLWDWASKKRIGLLPSSTNTNDALSFSPDGKRLASIGNTPTDRDQKVRIWDVATRKETSLIALPDAKTEIAEAVFSSDGRKLFTLDSTNGTEPTFRHWDLATGKQEQSWPLQKEERAGRWANHLTPDGKTLLTTSGAIHVAPDGKTHVNPSDHPLRIYDAETGRRKSSWSEPSFGWHYTLSPDGRVLGSHPLNQPVGTFRLWEFCTGQEIFLLKEHCRYNGFYAWSPDGRLFATNDNGETPSRIQTKDLAVYLWDTATGKRRAVFGGFDSPVSALTFSPDGAYLVAGLFDGTILAWEMAEAIPKVPAPKLSKDALEARWTDLISDKASQAHQAIGILVASPAQAVPFLRDRLRPTLAVDAGKIQRWIADLDSDQFAVRESASKELAKIDAQVEPHIRKALKGEVSPETARRLERILSTVDNLDASTVRMIRAVTILERIGSSDARAVLEALAGGAQGSRATEEAAASLQRLARRR